MIFYLEGVLKRKAALCCFALMGLPLTGCGGESVAASGERETSVLGESAIAADCTPLQSIFSDLLRLTNKARSEAGVPDLKFAFQLGQSAQAYAEDLATQDFFAHKGLDGSIYTSRIAAAGYRSTAVGENLIAGYTTAAQAIQGWLNSPTHRANLLHESFTEVGFGMFDATGDSTYGRYWVQHLGKPAGDAVSDERAYIPQRCGLPVADMSGLPQAVAARSYVELFPERLDSKVLPEPVQTPETSASLPVNAPALQVTSAIDHDGVGVAEPVPEPAVAIGLAALGLMLVRSQKST